VPRPVPPHRPEAWTVFGRWRRPSPFGRALGVALLLLSLALTVWWASTEGRVPADGPPAAFGAAVPATSPATLESTASSERGCAPDAPDDARPLTLPLASAADGGADPWAPWLGEPVCLTHPLLVAEVYELLHRQRLWAAAERPWVTTPSDELLRGALWVRPAAAATPALLLPAHDAAASVSASGAGVTASGAGVTASGAGVLASGAGAWGLGDGDLRNGDALEGLYGTLRLEDGQVVLEAPSLTVRRLNPRPPAPPALTESTARPPTAAGGAPPSPPSATVRVAGFNLQNWFFSLGARGAATPLARDRQAAKLVATLLALDADALALAEVENDDGAALADLLRRLNAAQRAAGRDAAADYVAARAPPSGRGRDPTQVGIAYRPALLTLLRTAVDRAPVHDRPPLAATFALADGRPAFTLIAAHHKAKSGCPLSGDVDRGSGCWDLRRDAQSQALLDFAAGLGGQRDDPPTLIVGDLNAYRHEAPLRRFADAGWRVLVDDMPAERAYAYVYFGRAGALTHALASPGLADRVAGAAFWAINADEPPRADASLPTPFRSSDHDPILLELRWD
jgi:hypothetical protein